MKNVPKITVATPTYNRGYCLNDVFLSLKNQTFQDFEWIVIDDGSNDNTRIIIESVASKAKFPVKYFRKENGGKHSAVNMALKEASGELFLIFDSDDRCTPTALEFMFRAWESAKTKCSNLAGVTTLSIRPDGSVIGSKFSGNGDIDYMYQYYQSHKIEGDKWDIHSTDILRLHPFPEIPGQKFCPESLVWNRIALRYKTAFYNEPTKIAVYLEDGLSKNLVAVRMRYPKLSIIYYIEFLRLDVGWISKLRAASNAVRFSLHDGSLLIALKSNFSRLVAGLLPGIVLYLKDTYFLDWKK